jgi:IS605 OrfB family transposase
MNTIIKAVEVKIEDTTLYPVLDNLASYYCHIEKTLYNYLVDKEITNELWGQIRIEYLIKYRIPARLFNAIFIDVKAKIDGVKKRHQQSIENSKYRITKLKEKIKKREKKIKTDKKLSKEGKNKLWLSVFQWKQKIDRLNQYINFHKPTKILFGTKNFYKKQWTLEEYRNDHEFWLKEWQRRRDYHFSFIGSKDETSGNLLCQYYIKDEQEFLQVRLPDFLIETCGKYIRIPVKFYSDKPNKRYYQDFITAVTSGTALFYQFIKKENGFWYVHVSFTLEKEISKNYTGCVGIDENYGLLATTTTNWSGNFLGMQNYTCDPEALSSEQMADLISIQLDEIVQTAKLKGYCISAENLDLSNKKLVKCDPITNRKIHMIAYDKIWKLLVSKCFRAGVPLIGVNPAYTSFIGHYKYEKMYGLSWHNAAAMCIARRGLGLKDKLPAFIASVLQSGEATKRKTKRSSTKASWSNVYRHRHHWAHWAYLKKNLERCSLSLQKELGDPGSGVTATAEDLLTSRFNPSYLSFIGR